MSGIERIAAERRRQIEAEGWTAEHDDEHDCGELVSAATCYAAAAQARANDSTTACPSIAELWPWSLRWWKPSPDPIRNLEKAGALIAAEIDRLERAALDELEG